MTKEDKAKAYADQPSTYKTWGIQTWDIHRQALIDAFLAGYNEARGSWKDASEQPEDMRAVVMISRNGVIAIGCYSASLEKWLTHDHHDFELKYWTLLNIPPIPSEYL